MSSEAFTHDEEKSPEVPREPWSYGKFVEHYNAEANRRGCWPYIEDSNTKLLQQFYEDQESNYKNLKPFAIYWLEYEQIYADDVLPKFMDYQAPKE